MSRPKRLGIGRAMWMAIGLTVASTMLGGAALHGYQVYRHQSAAEELRARTLAGSYAAQAAGWLAVSREELGAQIDRLRWHPDTYLLAVLAGDLTEPIKPGDPRVAAS